MDIKLALQPVKLMNVQCTCMLHVGGEDVKEGPIFDIAPHHDMGRLRSYRSGGGCAWHYSWWSIFRQECIAQSSFHRPGEMLGCFRSPEEREQARISREIQRMLEQERKKQDKELKLLLLGELISFGARVYECTHSKGIRCT